MKKRKNNSLEFYETMNILNQVKNRQGAGILVDVGHSCSHIIPIFDNQIISNSIRRAEVGGKLISKFLMESVSLTQFDLSRHFFLVTDLKEKCCQILSSPEEFLDYREKPSLNRLARVFYALNDYEIQKRGDIVSNPTSEQLKIAKNLRNLVTLQLERIIFPEILFQPSL
jgi:actin-related protein 6